jgi:hypothetical protein
VFRLSLFWPCGSRSSVLPRCVTLRSFSLASSHPSQDSYPLTVGHPRMVGFQGFAPLVSP